MTMQAKNKTTALLEKKGLYLKEFLRLTVSQKKALVERDTDRFNELLEAKQAVIEQVEQLDRELALGPKGGRQTNSSEVSSPTGGGHTGDRADELEKVIIMYLRQVRALDMEINELMKQNLAETAKNINRLQVARQTHNAYQNNSQPVHSCFVNKKR